MGGKYPSEVEKDASWVFLFILKFWVSVLSSSAIAKPIIVTSMAVIFKYHGIVITWMLVGGMLWEMKNPAKMLPSAKRLIGLIRSGLFSFMIIRGG